MRRLIVTLAAACLLAGPAAAQDGSDPESAARFHLGPIAIAPSVTLRNIGIDTNVFNEIDGSPRRDFTATLGSRVDTWWRVSRARFRGTNGVDLVYFDKYVDQRSVNMENQIRVDVPLNRINPHASVSVVKTRERPTAEIDVRAPRVTINSVMGAEVRATGKLRLDITSSRSRIAYESSQDAFGSVLQIALTRSTLEHQFAMRYVLTPLTTLVLAIQRQEDRFDFSAERHANGISIKPGIELRPLALVSGTAHIGYRRFRPLSPIVPEFTGTAADVDLRYTLSETTRVTTRIDRDVNFSFEATQPYYVLTGMSASLDRHIRGAWDATTRVSKQRLAYRSVVGVTTIHQARLDTVTNYGVSLGYRIGRDRRIGADFDYVRRRSGVNGRNYQGLRFGMSATYPL
jgi:hypothetical protein